MKKTLYADPSERTPKVLENPILARSMIKKLNGAEFVNDTIYHNREEFIYLIIPFGANVHYEYLGRRPQISIIGDPAKITDLEKIITEKFFALESSQTTLK